jgi:hypothetical protein
MVRDLSRLFPALLTDQGEIDAGDLIQWLSSEVISINELYPRALNRVIGARKEGGSLVNWLYDHFTAQEIVSYTNSRQFWNLAKQILPEHEWGLRGSYSRAWRKEKKRLQSQLPLN